MLYETDEPVSLGRSVSFTLRACCSRLSYRLKKLSAAVDSGIFLQLMMYGMGRTRVSCSVELIQQLVFFEAILRITQCLLKILRASEL